MSPLRIIILAILVYIGYRLIVGGFKKDSKKVGSNRASSAMPASDTLEEDPICKKLVPRQQAIKFKHAGGVHYFCSEECCKSFRKTQGD